MFSSADYSFMAQALRLAEKGLYSASPNPRVGCVLVRNGQVIGSGWHERAGGHHAEINALSAAGRQRKARPLISRLSLAAIMDELLLAPKH